MTESFFDRVDAAYAEKGKPANDADKPFSDDVCPCDRESPESGHD